jgi:hypothetical protein
LFELFSNTEFRLTGTCPRPPAGRGHDFFWTCDGFLQSPSVWPEKKEYSDKIHVAVEYVNYINPYFIFSIYTAYCLQDIGLSLTKLGQIVDSEFYENIRPVFVHRLNAYKKKLCDLSALIPVDNKFNNFFFP